MGNTNRTDTRATVLVVDDDRETADLYTDFLAEEYSVRTAYSGEEALAAVDAAVDVVLLDRRMPGISGDEVLQTIRERDLNCRVVMVTAIDPDVAVLDLPFDDYLVKPASRDMIRRVVSAMFTRNTCNETIREVLAVASQMATLESKLSIAELAASSEYAAVEARFNDLRDGAVLGKQTCDVYEE
jgi:DNA-binding response OmpR family regulator